MDADQILDRFADTFTGTHRQANEALGDCIVGCRDSAASPEAAFAAVQMLLAAGKLELRSPEFRANFARALEG